MAKFRFRLATLLKLREAARDERYARLAEAHNAEDILGDRKTNLAEQIGQLRQQYQKTAQPGTLDLDQLIESHRYETVLKSDEKELEDQMAMLGEEIARRREALVSADRDVRVLEKLRESQRQRHRKEAEKQEMKELDEIAGQIARRNKTEWTR